MNKLKLNILNTIHKFGDKGKNLNETINYIVDRSRWVKVINF